MDLSRDSSSKTRVPQPTQRDIEVRIANERINAYLAGASRPVIISRAVVGGFLLVTSAFLWWQGL